MPAHRFTLGDNVLNLYDGTRDLTLVHRTRMGTRRVTGYRDAWRHAVPKGHGAAACDVPAALNFANYGIVTFWRQIVVQSGTVSVVMATEPADPALATTVDFDGSAIGETQVIAAAQAADHRRNWAASARSRSPGSMTRPPRR